MSQTSPKRLSVERLEDRLTPTNWYTPWYDSGSLTLSFVPDGTDTGSGAPSTLTTLLGPTSQPAWKKEILRAYQTWADQTNVNIGLVPDTGAPLGTPGQAQGDSRFGDVRVAARSLSNGTNDGALA